MAETMTRETVTPCPYCGSDDYDPATTCPRSIECPHCHAKPGSPCRRPSGHRAMSLHAERIRTAERADELAAPTQLELTHETGAEPMAAYDDHRDERRPITEPALERITDREVQRRLQTDPRYVHADNAEDQAIAEEAIETETVAELERRYRLVDSPPHLAG